MKKFITLALIGTATLFAESMAVSFDVNKVSTCGSPTAKMTVLNVHSENNETFLSMGICQYEDGKINIVAIVNESKKAVLAPIVKIAK